MLHLPYRIKSHGKKHKSTEVHADEIDYRIHRQHSTISRRVNSELTSYSSNGSSSSNSSIDSNSESDNNNNNNNNSIRNSRDNNSSSVIDKYFDIPPLLIVCLVRHMNKEYKAITTPPSIEKCVRELQSYFTPSVAASTIRYLGANSLINTNKSGSASDCYTDNNPTMSLEHQVKLEFGKSLDVFEPLSKAKMQSKETVSSNASNTVIKTNATKPSSKTVSVSNNSNVSVSNVTDKSSLKNKGTQTKEEQSRQIANDNKDDNNNDNDDDDDNDVANNVLLYICLYDIDEDTSSPAILTQMATEWRRTLQQNGKEQDILFMLYSKSVAEETTIVREMESPWTSPQINSSTSTNTGSSNNNNNNIKLEKQYKQSHSKPSKWGIHTMMDYMTVSSTTTPITPKAKTNNTSTSNSHLTSSLSSSSSSPLSSSAASATPKFNHTSNSSHIFQTYFAELRTLHFDTSQMCVYTSHDAPLLVKRAMWFAQERQSRRLAAQLETYAQLKRRLPLAPYEKIVKEISLDKVTNSTHSKSATTVKVDYNNGNGSTIRNTTSEQQTYWSIQHYWRLGYRLALHELQFGKLYEAQEAFSKMFSMYYNNSDDFVLVRETHTLHRLYKRQHKLFTLPPASQQQEQQQHHHNSNSEMLCVVHESGDLLKQLLRIVACEMHCAVWLNDLQSAEHFFQLFMQVVKEKFDEDDKMMRRATTTATSSDKENSNVYNNDIQEKKSKMLFSYRDERQQWKYLFQLQCYLAVLYLIFKETKVQVTLLQGVDENVKSNNDNIDVIEATLHSYIHSVNNHSNNNNNNSNSSSSSNDILYDLIYHLQYNIINFFAMNTEDSKTIHQERKEHLHCNANAKKLTAAQFEVMATLCLRARDVIESMAISLEKRNTKAKQTYQREEEVEEKVVLSVKVLKQLWQWLVLAAACCHRTLNKTRYNKLEFSLWLCLSISYAKTHCALAQELALYLLYSLQVTSTPLQEEQFQWHTINQLIRRVWVDSVQKLLHFHDAHDNTMATAEATLSEITNDKVNRFTEEEIEDTRTTVAHVFHSFEVYNMYISSLLYLIKNNIATKCCLTNVKLSVFATYSWPNQNNSSSSNIYNNNNNNDVNYWWEQVVKIDKLIMELKPFDVNSTMNIAKHALTSLASNCSFHVYQSNNVIESINDDNNDNNYNNIGSSSNVNVVRATRENAELLQLHVNDEVQIVFSAHCYVNLSFADSPEVYKERRVLLTLESRRDWEDDNEPIHVVELENFNDLSSAINENGNRNREVNNFAGMRKIYLAFPFKICHAGIYYVKSVQIYINSTELYYSEENDNNNRNNGRQLFHVEEVAQEELNVSIVSTNISTTIINNKCSENEENVKRSHKQEEQWRQKVQTDVDHHYFADAPTMFALRINGVEILQEATNNSFTAQAMRVLDKRKSNDNANDDERCSVHNESNEDNCYKKEQICFFKVSEVLALQQEEEEEEEEEEQQESEEQQEDDANNTAEVCKFAIDQANDKYSRNQDRLMLEPSYKETFLESTCSNHFANVHLMQQSKEPRNDVDSAKFTSSTRTKQMTNTLENKTSPERVSPFNSFSSFVSASFWRPFALDSNASLFGVIQVKLINLYANNLNNTKPYQQQQQEEQQPQSRYICVKCKGRTYELNKSFALQSTPREHNFSCAGTTDLFASKQQEEEQVVTSHTLSRSLSSPTAAELPAISLSNPNSEKRMFVIKSEDKSNSINSNNNNNNNNNINTDNDDANEKWNDDVLYVYLFHTSQRNKRVTSEVSSTFIGHCNTYNTPYTVIPCRLSQLLESPVAPMLQHAKVQWECQQGKIKEMSLPELSIESNPLHSLAALLRHGLHFKLFSTEITRSSNSNSSSSSNSNNIEEKEQVNKLEINKKAITCAEHVACPLHVSLPLLPLLLRSESTSGNSNKEEEEEEQVMEKSIKLSFFQVNGEQVRSCALRTSLFLCNPAFDVQYTFRQLHQRVYCVVQIRTLLQRTSLRFRGALLHLSRVGKKQSITNINNNEKVDKYTSSSNNNNINDHGKSFCNDVVNSYESDYEVVRVSPVYNHLLECEWKPQMQVQLLFELALKDVTFISESIATNTNTEYNDKTNENVYDNCTHTAQLQIFYSSWQCHELEHKKSDESVNMRNVLRYHQEEMYEESDTDDANQDTSRIENIKARKANTDSNSSSSSSSSNSSDTQSEMTNQPLRYNKSVVSLLNSHYNSYWGHCAMFHALRNAMFTVHIDVSKPNEATLRSAQQINNIIEENVIDTNLLSKFQGNNDNDNNNNKKNNNKNKAFELLELMRYIETIKIGQIVHFTITLEVNPANWPEHAAEREEFVIEFIVNPSQWKVIGKQRICRVISLMESKLIIPFSAIPLPRQSNVDDNNVNEELSKGKNRSTTTFTKKNNNTNREDPDETTSTTSNKSSNTSSSNSESEESTTENEPTVANENTTNEHKLASFTQTDREMRRVREHEHILATPTIRVFWMNKHNILEKANNAQTSHYSNDRDEGIVEELVELDILQFRPTMNIKE